VPDAESHNLDYAFGGYEYVLTLGIELPAGRTHDADDRTAVVLNEAATREFRWTPDAALGKKISWA